MKRSLQPALLCALFLIACNTVENPTTPPSPTPLEDERHIASAERFLEFISVADTLGAKDTVFLTADIDLKNVTVNCAESFAGVLDGCGYSIDNWTTATAPLFKLSTGTIKNLNIGTGCIYTATAGGHNAFIVGQNAGTIIGCSCSGEIKLTLTSNSSDFYLGSLVSYTKYGTISDCVFEGSINGSIAELANNSYIGGVIGRVNGNKASSQILTDCINKGTISISIGKLTKHANVGGVCGSSVGSGITSGCSNEGNIEVLVKGQIAGDLLKTGGQVLVGGVLGHANPTVTGYSITVQECTNKGSVELKGSDGLVAGGERMGCGGIIGKSFIYTKDPTAKSKLKNCTNKEGGKAASNINTLVSVGGVAGVAEANVEGCSNYGEAILENPYGNTTKDSYSGVGAICGSSKGNISDFYAAGTVNCTGEGIGDAGGVCGMMTAGASLDGTDSANIKSTTACGAGYIIGSCTSGTTVTLGTGTLPLKISEKLCVNGTYAKSSDISSDNMLVHSIPTDAAISRINLVFGDATVTLKDGYPAWFSAVESNFNKWESAHTMGSSSSYGKSGGIVTALSENGNELIFKAGVNSGVSGYSDNDLCAGNMGEGDYFLFKVPVHSLLKGSDVDFMSNFTGRGQGVPKYWLFEYFDGTEWNTADDKYNSVKTLPDGTKYSFRVIDCGKNSYQISTCFASFTTKKDIKDEYLLMRVKAVGNENVAGGALSPDKKSFMCLSPSPIAGGVVQVYEVGKYPAVKDTKKLGILGNSFTYCYATAMLLKRVARSQGHQLIIRVNHKGGQTFGDHLGLSLSKDVWEEGGYDLFLLQDQSNAEAEYADNPITYADVAENAKTLTGKIKEFSPTAEIILENTWSYIKPPTSGHYKDLKWMGFGSFEAMDAKIEEGCRMVKEKCPAISRISPIGKGFAAYRAQYPDFYKEAQTGTDSSKSIYRKNDNSTKDHHHNFAGAYLKACVNYLTIYGQTDFDNTVDNCLTDATRAAELRKCAKVAIKK